ncbi:hypothetical protein ACCC94_26170, partial [Pseudomonas sp. Pseusp97]
IDRVVEGTSEQQGSRSIAELERYRDRLREAGVAVDYFPGAGLVHGCLRARRVAEVDALRGALIAALRRNLSR